MHHSRRLVSRSNIRSTPARDCGPHVERTPRAVAFLYNRGSRPSPSRFIPSTVSMMPSPGKVEIHHASRR